MESEGRSCSFDLELITPLMVHGSRFRVMTDTTMIDRLKQFVESEMHSCSMDIGGITPLYVYRMWGGSSSYRRYCHCDGRCKKEDVKVKGL